VAAADALPEYHHRERHSIAVGAPAGRALAAAREVQLADLPVVRGLVRLRGMRPQAGSLWDAMRGTSFRERGDDTLVAVGRPWQVRGGMREVDDFDAFVEPGYAKMAVDLRFADGHLVTETRVFLTSPEARRRFRAYWLLIRPFSGLTRRLWLRAAKRRAEQ
jgi:hypothetical protein